MNNTNVRKNVIWNLVFSIAGALQTVLLLLIVNRVLGEESAGIFGYAFSVAVLLMYIGNFGIRNFQVTDSNEIYSPYDYYSFRIITCIFMLAALFIYIAFYNQSADKSLVVILLTFERLAECIEDVFHGRYQQKGDLYKAGIQGTVRFAVSDIFFLVVIICSNNLIMASCAYAVSAFIITIMYSFISLKEYGGFRLSFDLKKMTGLFLCSFSLFLGYFLNTYLTNVPKYTIDSFSNEGSAIFTNITQAYFNMIFMPVLMINLLSLVIFRPFIVDMSKAYNDRHFKEYHSIVNRQFVFILGIAVLILPVCFYLGIPVLSWFYSSDLAGLKKEFMILMLGGVFSSVSCFLNICIITIRKQNILLISTLIVSALAFVFNMLMPEKYGLMGISCIYLIVMIIQAFMYYIIHAVCVYIASKTENKG